MSALYIFTVHFYILFNDKERKKICKLVKFDQEGVRPSGKTKIKATTTTTTSPRKKEFSPSTMREREREKTEL